MPKNTLKPLPRLDVGTIGDVAKRLLDSHSWKVGVSRNAYADGYEIVIQPNEYGVVLLHAEDFELPNKELSSLLFNRLRRLQNQIVDKLDNSVGRLPRRTDEQPTGHCEFCGAPYGLKPGGKRC